MHAVGRFIRRHAVLILFVITLSALALIYENQQNAIDQIDSLTAQLATQQEADQKAACQTSLTSRADQVLILNQVVAALPNTNLAARLQVAIDHAFDEPPATCKGVDLSQPPTT
jgi:hypothetical protein